MKKTALLLTGVLLYSGVLLSQPVSVRLNLEKDKEYTQTITSQASVNQVMNGIPFTHQLLSENTLVYRVVNVNENDFDLSVYLQNIKITIKQGEDSFVQGSDTTGGTVSEVLGKMVGKPYHLKLSGQGKVISVDGMDEVIDTLVDGLHDVSPAQGEAIKAHIIQTFGDDAFVRQWESMMAFLPPRPVEKGESWQAGMPWNEGTFLNTTCKFTLRDVDSHFIYITGEEEWMYGDEHKLKGKMVAEYKLDLLTGWITEAVQSYEVDGNLPVNPQMGYLNKQMIVPINLKSEIKITD